MQIMLHLCCIVSAMLAYAEGIQLGVGGHLQEA